MAVGGKNPPNVIRLQYNEDIIIIKINVMVLW